MKKLTTIREDIKQVFSDLIFVEETHTYSLKSDPTVKFKSATGVIKNYVKEFNPYLVSEEKAKNNLKKNPNDPRDGSFYRKRWKLQEQEALARGNRVHYYAECYPFLEEPYCNKEKGVYEFFNNFLPPHIHVLLIEIRMFDSSIGLAGTADLLLYDESKDKIIIADWKTNRNLFEYYGNLDGAFSKYQATSYYKYSIQLSIYKYLIEKHTQYKVSEGWIMWLIDGPQKRSTNEKRIIPMYKGDMVKIYKVKDFSKTIGKELERSNVKLGKLW